VRQARFAALAIAIVAVLHGALTNRWVGSAITLLALLVSASLPARATLETTAQRLITLPVIVAGAAVGWLETAANLPPLSLARGWSAAAVAALFAASFRAFVRAPEGGFFPTFLLGLGAVVACGETRTGPLYTVFVVAYLVAALAALRAHDPGRPRLPSIPVRTWTATALQLTIAAAVTLGLAIVLPPAAGWTRDRLINSLGDAQTGLGERMVLGSLEGMLQSDEIVARVYGPHVDYLRGVVYDHYQAGQWASSTSDGMRTVNVPLDPAHPAPSRVVFVGAGRNTRYLLPLGASSVTIAESSLIVDRFGSVRPERGVPTQIAFSQAGAPDFPPSEPTQDDRRMPLKLARSIRPLVREWTAGADTAEQKIEAIARHLREEGRYSLTYQRGTGDPLLEFLTENRVGHCEYFASGMVMLARASGIPARVVAGYRVAEHNDLGGYDIVREKNAHAWAEVYFEGKGWQTIDPTPEDLLPQNRPHASRWLPAAWDLLATWWSALVERLAALTLWQIIGALLVVIVVGLIVRRLRARGRAEVALEQAFFRLAAPPPPLTRLLASLAETGHSREPSEPLERFALRLEEGRQPEPAALLARYAAFQYGGIGDRDTLYSEMDACATRLRRGNG